MKGSKTKDLERMVSEHYRSVRAGSDPCDRARLVETLVAATDARTMAVDRPTLVEFIVSQLRFIRWHVWILNLTLVVAMAALCLIEEGHGPLLLASSVLGAASVLVAIPSLLSSGACRMVELECACRFNCRSVALARLIILGCSDVLVMTAMAVIVPILSGTDGFDILLHACAPYFLACAGCLWASRTMSASGALMLSAGWVGAVMALAVAVYLALPAAYLSASMGVWVLIAMVGFIWMIRELSTWLRSVSAGLEHLTSFIVH